MVRPHFPLGGSAPCAAPGAGETERIHKAAFRALSQLRAWGFEPLNLVPVAHGIVDRIAADL